MAKDNHHYVPQGYLRGFTIEGGDRAQATTATAIADNFGVWDG